MIKEQLQALGNVLKSIKRSEIVGLINRIGYQKIYAYKSIEEDLKGKSIQWIVEATNHEKFNCLSPYYIVKGNTLYSFRFNDIDFTELAEYLFCRYSVWNKMPECVQEILDDEEYKWEFIEYVKNKAGAEENQVLDWFNKIEFNYRKDWFNLYCDFISIL